MDLETLIYIASTSTKLNTSTTYAEQMCIHDDNANRLVILLYMR